MAYGRSVLPCNWTLPTMVRRLFRRTPKPGVVARHVIGHHACQDQSCINVFWKFGSLGEKSRSETSTLSMSSWYRHEGAWLLAGVKYLGSYSANMACGTTYWSCTVYMEIERQMVCPSSSSQPLPARFCFSPIAPAAVIYKMVWCGMFGWAVHYCTVQYCMYVYARYDAGPK